MKTDKRTEVVARALCNDRDREEDLERDAYSLLSDHDKRRSARPPGEHRWQCQIAEAQRFIRAYEALKAFDAAQDADEGMKPDELNAENDG